VMGVPILLIIGEKEKDENNVAIRYLGTNDQQIIKLDDFLNDIKIKITPPDLI